MQKPPKPTLREALINLVLLLTIISLLSVIVATWLFR